MDERFIMNNDDGRRYVIIKVGSKKVLENMGNGEWWLQHPAFFQKDYKNHSDIGRADNEDSLIEYQNVKKMQIDHPVHVFSGTVLPSTISFIYKKYTEDDSARIICFYKLFISDDGSFYSINERMEGFGKYFAFVDINRAKELLQIKVDEMFYGKLNDFDMEYYNDSYSGKVGVSGKRKEYAYQCEYRIRIDSIDNLKEIIKDQEIQKIEKEMKDVLQEQEKNAELCRNAVILEEKEKYKKLTIGANKHYEELYYSYLNKKSEYALKYKTITECLSNVYEFKELFGRKGIFDFQ